MAEADLPPERDVKDFKFQQLCKVRVANSPSVLPKSRVSLIISSSKYGLTFLAVDKGFKVFRTSDFILYDQRHATDRLKHVITDLPVLAEANVGYDVTHLNLSADELTLAVAITRPEHAVVYLYDVRNFAGPVSGTVQAFHMIVGEGSAPLNDLAWNPVDPNLLIICYCTGRLDIYIGQARKASLSSAKAKCVCWSPKGKQLVIGRDDGTLVQYDPDLNEKRMWDRPNILTTASEAFDLVWLSTYSFLVAYISVGADCSVQPSVILVNGSKEGPISYSHFEDICFGSGEERERKYYFSFVQKWDMVLAASSNAAEIGIVGKHIDNKQVWERWVLDDSARAECPLTDDYGDTFPMGISIDYSSQHPIPLGEDKTLSASPILLVLTTEGLVIPFHMMYMNQAAPVLNAPAQALDTAGLRKASGVPPSPASQPAGVVKNLFGMATTQPASQPATAAASGFAFSAASLGNSTTKTGTTSGFSFTGGSGVLGTADSGTRPKFGTSLGLSGSTSQPSAAPSFAFATGTQSAPAAKSDQSETKPPVPAGFGTSSFAGSTNKSGASAGFSMTSTFGAPAAGSGGFAAKPTITTDAVPISVAPATSTGFNFITKPGTGSSTTGFGAFASRIPDANITKTSEPPAQPVGFGLTSSAADTSGSPGLNLKPTVAGFGSSATGSGKPVSNPVSSLAGQSSAFTGMPSAAAAKPLSKPDIQASGQPQSAGSTFAPKSPTSAPPPAYPSGLRAESPKFAPPPQYPRDTQSKGDEPDAGEATDVVDQQFSKSIMDEIDHFNRELSEFRCKAAQTTYVIGTREDIKRLKKDTQEMETFCNDIKTSVQEQNKEVQEQRALCLDMFSMVEECRIRQHMNTDQKYLHLHKSRALDPGSAEKLEQLQLQYQVLDQGLRDVDLILDTQWEEYQNRKKNRTNRVQNPTNDSVYRVVKSNHNLILAQKTKLKELEERLKQLKLYNKTSAWNNTSTSFTSSDTTTELSHLADTLLSVNPEKSQNDSSVKEERSVNNDRLDKLREHLYRRNVSVIRSTKPGNLSVLKIPDNQLENSVFRNSQQNLTELKGAPRNAGDFVGMFRRTRMPPPVSQNNKTGSPAGSTSSSQSNLQATRSENEKNKQDVQKDKDGTISGFLRKIIEKGGEKVNQLLPNKSQAKPTVPPNQGLNNRPPAQPAAIPKTVQTAMQSEKQPGQKQETALKVKELNGIKYEDITPSGSENDVNTEEDEEYDEEEETSGSSGEGFAYDYIPPPVSQIGQPAKTTPVTGKAASKPPGQEGFTATSTPVGRKLFPADEAKPAPSFNFAASTAGSSSMKFGFNSSTADTKAKAFPFVPPVSTATSSGQLETSKPQTGFNFSLSGTPSFGAKTQTQSITSKDEKTEGATKAGQITGLFGKEKTPTAESGTSETQSEAVSTSSKPTVPFGQPTTKSGTIFGQPISTSAPTSFIFGQPVSSSTTPKTIFGQSSGSSVIGQPSDAVTSTEEGVDNSREATQASPTQPSNSAEESEKSDTGKPAVASGGFFGKSSTSSTSTSASSGVFGQSGGSGLFGLRSGGGEPFGKRVDSTQSSTASSTPSFVAQTTATTASGTGPFGQATTTTSGTGLFGQVNTTAASGTGLFGQAAVMTAAESGLFGQPTSTTPASGIGLFSQAATTTAAGTGLFGQATSTSTSGTGLFGQSSTATTSGTGLFGQATPTTASGTGLFGQATTTSTSEPGLFGNSSTPASGTGLFGQAPTATSATTGLFGQATTTTSGSGLFGQAATSAGSSGGLFGQPASTSSGGLFGQTTSSSGSGLFGQSSTSSTGGLFGQPGGSSFGQTSTSSGGLFGQPASTSSGLFGQTSTSTGGSLFGSSGGSGFGTATSGSGFGFCQTPSSGFGSTAFGQSPGFGQAQSSGSPFGQTSSDSGAGSGGSGGGLFSGLGGKPSAEKANSNVFGSSHTFGSSQSSSQGLFGSGTTQTFGSGTGMTGGFSSGGTFSSGSGVGSTGFGAAKPPGSGGFGGSPAFGSGPAFGGTPGFGTQPTFGNQPTFGGTSSSGGFGSAPTFGSPSGATFGSVAQQGGDSGGFGGFGNAGSPTFGALAQTSDAPSFGNLGQSPNTNTGFGGNTGNTFGSSPSFTGYRG